MVHTGHRGLAVGLAICVTAGTQTPASAATPPAAPGAGYHHLGATTAGDWSGVLGRLTVRDADVRPGTFDFLAVRFMAKRTVDGRVAWLEAGWAETGWSGEGRQRIYTYDSASNAWTFYDRFNLRDGDQVWLYVHTGTVGDAPTWQAWLLWEKRWRLLASRELPLGPSARMEQYVEVHVDPRTDRKPFAVPPVAVDNVHVKPSPKAAPRPWGDDVATAPSRVGPGRYCVQWLAPYHRWQAGDCPGGSTGPGGPAAGERPRRPTQGD